MEKDEIRETLPENLRPIYDQRLAERRAAPPRSELRPGPGPLRWFWNHEVVGRASDLYHNDALNLPVKLLTGSRMDDPVTPGRVITTAASLFPLFRSAQVARASSAPTRLFAGLTFREGSYPGKLLFHRASRIPSATVEGVASVDAAAAELLKTEAPLWKTMSAAASPVRSLAESIFKVKAPAIGTGTRMLVDATSIATEAAAANLVFNEGLAQSSGANAVPTIVSTPAQLIPTALPPPPTLGSANRRLKADNDETALENALQEWQDAGGASNKVATAAFYDRTSGIFKRAVVRMYPGLNKGVPYSTAFAASHVADEEVSASAAESIRRVEDYVRGLDPREWLEKKGGQ